ncbi:alpha/beta fold hydrolase [Streptococcus downei]|uniref:Hydrolase, alpha/beta hydrolase fold family n=1 Tax=Streptococcus downei MFe28 TaxID=764290 RepID=A0A380JG02_STRDO|nr:alpha/beta hydrolase [Streptococcus downei]EFQ57666.1 hydrolase, alpha/beta domain protein [Streptococcus downei F0415]SUN36328.1 Hydrolase, alpha/beta hydrolase fold family [Streptococcus downei MFe28]
MVGQEKWIETADGTFVYVEIFGQGQPLVFLHGNSSSSRYFKQQISFFVKNYQVIVLDSRGHGRTQAKAQTISFDQMADDLHQVFTVLKIQKAILVGHSDGANLAMIFQKKYPQAVVGMLLNSGNITTKALHLADRLLIWLAYGFLAVLSLLIPSFKAKSRVIYLMLQDLTIKQADLAAVRVPVLVLVGKHDLIKLSYSRSLASYFPKGIFYSLKGFGHNIVKKDSQTFNQITHQFIKHILLGVPFESPS